MPRIAMVSANAFPVMGGTETHVYEVAPRLAQAGYDVTVLTTDRSGQLPEHGEMRGVPIRRVRAWPASRDYYWAPGIYRTIRQEKWDLVHCQGYHTLVAPIAMAACMREHIPYVLTFHSGGHDSAMRTRLRGAQHLALRPMLRRAARLIAVSDWEAREFAAALHLARDRFEVIPNGAELAAAGQSADPDEPRAGESLILSVGRIERYKGHQRVVAAMPALLELKPDARLRIVGAGPYEEELRRQVDRSPARARIEIAPVDAAERGQMAALLMRADLVVAMSEYESQGIAVSEALSLGRRVLVADTSALSDYARRGLARAVALDAAPADLARAIAGALDGAPPPPLALPTWDACAARLSEIYAEVLAS